MAEPLLFGLVGTAVDFHYINASTIPKSLLVIISGWAARCPATFFAVMGAGLTWKERLFVTLTWLPKATVQAVRFLNLGIFTLLGRFDDQVFPSMANDALNLECME